VGTIAVTPSVYAEVLRASGLTIDEVNALPFEERARMIGEARIRLSVPKLGGDRDAAAAIREDRERRKAEAWARRQPKK
jgi:hypothetical protein